MSLQLKIVTPDKIFFDGPVDMLIARGVEGDFAVMQGHTPFVTVLDIRKLRIKIDGKYEEAAIAGGYLDVRNDEIIIVSSACEWVKDIDVERARKAKERAEARLKEKNPAHDLDRAEIALKKAINRLDLSKK